LGNFFRKKLCISFDKNLAWATFWAIFSISHLVTLTLCHQNVSGVSCFQTRKQSRRPAERLTDLCLDAPALNSMSLRPPLFLLQPCSVDFGLTGRSKKHLRLISSFHLSNYYDLRHILADKLQSYWQKFRQFVSFLKMMPLIPLVQDFHRGD
jgi:hypothetical protein